MSYLDELKGQTEKQKQQAEADKQKAEQQEKAYQKTLLPKMEQIFTYLSEVCAHLNKLNMDTLVDYQLETLATLTGLRQSDYVMQTDSSKEMKSLQINFECAKEGELEVVVETKPKVEQWTQYLQQHNLKFHTRKQLDENQAVIGARFIIQNHIPISFRFQADVDHNKILLNIHNFDKPGVQKVQFTPESMNEEALDRMAKYIAREESSLFSLEMSESDRQRLRARVMFEQQQREEELREAEKRQQEEREQSKKRGLLDMFKRK